MASSLTLRDRLLVMLACLVVAAHATLRGLARLARCLGAAGLAQARLAGRLAVRLGRRTVRAGRAGAVVGWELAGRHDFRLARGFLAGLLFAVLLLRLTSLSPTLAASHGPAVAPSAQPSSHETGQAAPDAGPRPAFGQPIPGAYLSQAFGASGFTSSPGRTIDGVRYAHFHEGIDFAAALGTPVEAAAAGEVVSAGPNFTGAVIVRIRHQGGFESEYGHLQAALRVKVGQVVDQGQVLGLVGMTGYSTGPHLHFGLWQGNQPLDPSLALVAGHLPGQGADLDAAGLARRFARVKDTIPYADLIGAAAAGQNLDPLLLAALVKAESRFQPRAVSNVGAQGLTQLMPSLSQAFHVSDPFDPAQNLQAGARYLGVLVRQASSLSAAIAAYHAGGANVARNPSLAGWDSTQRYVGYVMANYLAYLAAAGA